MGLVSLVLPALLAGCGTTERSTSAAAEATPAATVAMMPAKGAGLTGTVAIAKVSGVDACDEYLHVYGRCVAERLRGEERVTHAAVLGKLKALIAARSKEPDREGSLEAECKHGIDSLPPACSL